MSLMCRQHSINQRKLKPIVCVFGRLTACRLAGAISFTIRSISYRRYHKSIFTHKIIYKKMHKLQKENVLLNNIYGSASIY